MTFDNFGKNLKVIWDGLRPVTKKMLVNAVRSRISKPSFTYDSYADKELSVLLDALDLENRKRKRKSDSDLRFLADICARVLEAQTESAEVFIQLITRALAKNDFAKVDMLGDVLFDRFTAGEIAEIIRQTDKPQIRAIAFETLAVLPVTLIVPLLRDPLYFDIACNVLEQQAFEFGSKEARHVLENIDLGEQESWQ